MSGGSFDYAYMDTWDLAKAESLLLKIYDMRGMTLTAYPETIPYLNDMAQFIEKIRDDYLERGQRIKDLLQSIEWCYSGDTGPDDIYRAINELKSKDIDRSVLSDT